MVYLKRTPVIERLMSKVNKEPGDGCWLWTGATCGEKDYGQMHVPPGGPHSSRLVHRISYEILVGPIPRGLEIDHLCRQPRCVNPAHLEAVENAVNQRRKSEAYTHCKRGHEMSGKNVMRCGDGGNRCRTCRYERQRELKQRQAQ